MLVARRRLDRRDDLTVDAQLREIPEARLAVGPVVAHGLVQADEALLDQIVVVAAREEVRGGLQADEAVVTAHDAVVRRGTALLCQCYEIAVVKLRLSLRLGGESGHGQLLPRAPKRSSSSMAHASPGAAPPEPEHA